VSEACLAEHPPREASVPGQGDPSPGRARRVLVLAGLLLLAAAGAAWVWVGSTPADPDSAERLGASVEMICTETGTRFSVTRGLVEAELRGRVGLLRESDGVASPFADERPVARMASQRQWRETIERINREKQGG
jgi:hypothetical protein